MPASSTASETAPLGTGRAEFGPTALASDGYVAAVSAAGALVVVAAVVAAPGVISPSISWATVPSSPLTSTLDSTCACAGAAIKIWHEI